MIYKNDLPKLRYQVKCLADATYARVQLAFYTVTSSSNSRCRERFYGKRAS
jgi:hypothetical protein